MDIWVISDQELLLLQMPLNNLEGSSRCSVYACLGVYTWRRGFFIGNTKLLPKWSLLKERHWDLGFMDSGEPGLSFENLFKLLIWQLLKKQILLCEYFSHWNVSLWKRSPCTVSVWTWLNSLLHSEPLEFSNRANNAFGQAFLSRGSEKYRKPCEMVLQPW